MDDSGFSFALRVVAAWERAYELERVWLESRSGDPIYDTWTQVAPGYWRNEVRHPLGSLIYEVLQTDGLLGYQAQVRLMTDRAPDRAVGRYEYETLEEAQADCTELAREIFSEGPTDITIPLRYFEE